MPGTLQRPWPPGTYEAAHRQARSPLNEARARAGLAVVVSDRMRVAEETRAARPDAPHLPADDERERIDALQAAALRRALSAHPVQCTNCGTRRLPRSNGQCGTCGRQTRPTA